MLLSQNLEPIQTHEIRPPVPTTRFDWVAYRDPERQPYGYGSTEAEAVRNLLDEEGMLDG